MRLGMDALNPTLLRCGYFNGFETMQMYAKKKEEYDRTEERVETGRSVMPSRICYDYEFEFFLHSDGGVVVNGEYIHFSQGEMNIRRPGQRVTGIPPYECYIICVDMAGARYIPQNYMFGDSGSAQPDYEDKVLRELPILLKPRHGERILGYIQKIQKILWTEDSLSAFRVNGLVRDILCEIFEDIRQEKHREQKVSLHMQKAVSYINEHFTEDIPIQKLIESTGLSKAYFHKSFKEYTGKTPLQMIASMRMEKARLMLSISNAKIADIATVCGYMDAVYFTSLFRKTYGVTPTEYRALSEAGKEA